MMCANCEENQRIIRELREELAEWQRGDGLSNMEEVHGIARATGLNPQPAKIIHRLMKSPSRTVNTEELLEVIDFNGKSDDLNALKVCIWKARRAMERVGVFEGITNVHSVGYIMPALKVRELSKAMDGRS